MKTSQTITKIAAALLKSQKEMGAVTKDSANPYFKSKYADINSMLDVAIPVLNANDIFVLQPASSDGTSNFVETCLIHSSGEFIHSEPLKLEPPKDMQQLGAAITYARRFSLQSLLGLRAEDDDGETAVGRGKSFSKPAATQPTTPVKKTEPVVPASQTTNVTPTAITAPVSLPVDAAKSSPSQTTPAKVETPKVEAPKKSTFRKPSTMKPTTGSNPFGA